MSNTRVQATEHESSLSDDELIERIVATDPDVARIVASKDREIARLHEDARDAFDARERQLAKLRRDASGQTLADHVLWGFVVSAWAGGFALCGVAIARYFQGLLNQDIMLGLGAIGLIVMAVCFLTANFRS